MLTIRLRISLVAVGIILVKSGFSWGQNNVSFIDKNVFVGNSAGLQNSNGANNVFVGYQSGAKSISGTGNTFLGYQSGFNTTTGVANVFVGSQAGFSNTSGTGNMFIGQLSGVNNTSASYNLFIGNSSGQATTTGSGNTAIGDGSSLRNTTGAHNTTIGQYAGENNVTGADNVFIGFNAGVPTNAGNLTNAIAIGASTRVTQSNSLILGTNANVGIGNSAPSTKLHITTGVANTSGLRLQNLTSSSPASVTNQFKFLSVDGSGNVILASSNGSAREAAPEALWQRNGAYLKASQGEAVVIGDDIANTPAEYNLFVSKGILTEKVKVAVKNTSDWSDKVFDKSYKLKSLGEVENYIKQTGHLPGVASAAEVVKHGIDLGRMDAKLLEKIEELTLYSIQLDKAAHQQQVEFQSINEKQQAEIDKLRRLVKQLLQKQ